MAIKTVHWTPHTFISLSQNGARTLLSEYLVKLNRANQELKALVYSTN